MTSPLLQRWLETARLKFQKDEAARLEGRGWRERRRESRGVASIFYRNCLVWLNPLPLNFRRLVKQNW